MPPTTDIVHAAVVAVGLVCYSVLVALGHDGSLVLAAALGYGGGVAATRVSSSKTPAPPAPPPGP